MHLHMILSSYIVVSLLYAFTYVPFYFAFIQLLHFIVYLCKCAYVCVCVLLCSVCSHFVAFIHHIESHIHFISSSLSPSFSFCEMKFALVCIILIFPLLIIYYCVCSAYMFVLFYMCGCDW